MHKGIWTASVCAVFLAACAHATGCLGVDAITCLRNAEAAGFRLSTELPGNTIDAQLAKNSRLDVNGKPIAKAINISLSGTLAGIGGIEMLELQMAPDDTVMKASITLPGDPLIAKTASEYDATGIFPAVSILLGLECAGHSSLAVYRFFENQIKPVIIRHKKQTELTDTSASTAYFESAENIAFCDAKMDFSDIFGIDTDDITVENPNGSYQLATLIAHH